MNKMIEAMHFIATWAIAEDLSSDTRIQIYKEMHATLTKKQTELDCFKHILPMLDAITAKHKLITGGERRKSCELALDMIKAGFTFDNDSIVCSCAERSFEKLCTNMGYITWSSWNE